MKRFSLIFLFLVLSWQPAATVRAVMAAADPEAAFFDANNCFAEERYEEAIVLYEQILQTHPSANVYYNLGNAYFQLGELGQARLQWERALAIDPDHSGARANVQYLVSEIALGTAAPSTSGSNWLQQVPRNGWIWIGTIAFWAAVFALAGRQWTGNRKRAKIFSAVAGIGAAAFALALTAISLNPEEQTAVVLGDTVARVAPAPDSPAVAEISAAELVQAAGRHGSYIRALLDDGREVYIPDSQVGYIR